MKYIQTASPDVVVNHIAGTLSSHLQAGERVVWLLSGGSCIPLETAAAQILRAYDTSRLFVGLADERYGTPGHKDENYTQILDLGFPLPISRILTGNSATETAAAFATTITQALHQADFSLGVFGIGADGHTAGIKPHSPSITCNEFATFYKWDDYERITMTPAAMRQLSEAIIYAVGSEKVDMLRSLLNEDLPLKNHPAQVLKAIKTSTLYTDNVL